MVVDGEWHQLLPRELSLVLKLQHQRPFINNKLGLQGYANSSNVSNQLSSSSSSSGHLNSNSNKLKQDLCWTLERRKHPLYSPREGI